MPILATSDDLNGPSPAQSMQRNLRPPVLTGVNRIGLRHLGQVGGGIFLGMAAHLGLGGSVIELSVTDGCPGFGGDNEPYPRLSGSRLNSN